MNLKNRNFTCKSAFIFLTLLSTQVSAGVRSMGQETTVDNGPYLQVSVQCTTQKSSIFLRRHKKGKEWCDQKLGVVCSARKMAAAQKICGRQYLSALNKDSMKNVPAQVISKRSTAVGASNPKKMAKG
ncbi:MAG: hypothetical protein JKX81_08085 [Arenicella sp.]|nr:hypothetical protein [Arenicella sp.]